MQTCNKMIWHQNIFNLELELGICKGLSKIYYDLTKGDVGFQEINKKSFIIVFIKFWNICFLIANSQSSNKVFLIILKLEKYILTWGPIRFLAQYL